MFLTLPTYRLYDRFSSFPIPSRIYGELLSYNMDQREDR
jgi:hypothetical protein